MFHVETSSVGGIQNIRATGTILASDVRNLFEHSDLDTSALKGVAIVIDPAFDGYLAEIATGLGKELHRLGRTDFKIALIMPETMMKEVALTRLVNEAAQVRVCAEATEADAMAWLAE